MGKKHPKYLRDLNAGTVTRITPLADFSDGEAMYEIIADLGNMFAQIFTEVEYTIGATIDLAEETPEQITMKGQVEFENLQPLLERFGFFQREGDNNITGQEVHTIGTGPNQFIYNENVPIVIKGYISSILDAARYCIDFQWSDGQVTLINDGDVSEYAPKTMYDIGVLHTQFFIELNVGEGISIGVPALRRRNIRRKKGNNKRVQQKLDAMKEVETYFSQSDELRHEAMDNHAKAAQEIKRASTSNLLPSAETIAETYLPKLFPKRKNRIKTKN